MYPVPLSIGSICLAALISIVSAQPTYLIPQQRTDGASISIAEQTPSSSVEFQLVPSNQYAVATVQNTDLSMLDYVLSPVTAVIGLSSSAMSAVSWMIINGSMVLLGMAIVVGFCAFTPYCTLTIHKPSFLARENMSAFPYFDELEYYFSEAYKKYNEMQNSV